MSELCCSLSVRIQAIRPPQLHLTPIDFEIPHAEGIAMFIGREWIFKDIDLVSNHSERSSLCNCGV